MIRSPIKFLESYGKDDKDIFFGRREETARLYDALSGVKLLLVYGPSGSGKTSLIDCGLRNQFSDADWFALSIRRGGDILASFYDAVNTALEEPVRPDSSSGLPADPEAGMGRAVEQLFDKHFQPVYLLFDQFEELLISGSAAEKKSFFKELNQLTRYRVPCRIVLIMREEFVGNLSEYEPDCPGIFQNRFRLEKMGREQVAEVVSNMLNPMHYAPDFEVSEAHRLCKSIINLLPDKRQEIELAHVQVFLSDLRDRACAEMSGGGRPRLHPALIRDTDNLESVLDVFLKKQLAELSPSFGEKAPLEVLAAMITEKHTKIQISEASLREDIGESMLKPDDPLPELLRELEARKIVRRLRIGTETHYEISHDVLALVVGQNITQEMKLRERAEEIYRLFEEKSGLFSNDDLNYLQAFKQYRAYPESLAARMAASRKQLEEQERSVLQASLQMADQKRKTRSYRFVAVVFSILAVTAVLALLDANRQRKEAVAQQEIAKEARDRADSSRFVAQEQTRIAEQKRVILQTALDSLTDFAQSAANDGLSGKGREKISDLIQQLSEGAYTVDVFYLQDIIAESQPRADRIVALLRKTFPGYSVNLRYLSSAENKSDPNYKVDINIIHAGSDDRVIADRLNKIIRAGDIFRLEQPVIRKVGYLPPRHINVFVRNM